MCKQLNQRSTAQHNCRFCLWRQSCVEHWTQLTSNESYEKWSDGFGAECEAFSPIIDCNAEREYQLDLLERQSAYADLVREQDGDALS